MNKSILKIPNKIRREFFQAINKDYIDDKLKKRKGKCRKCGDCCKGCNYLDKNKLCKVYGNRPGFCHKEFPIDELDQKIFDVKNCGFYFNG